MTPLRFPFALAAVAALAVADVFAARPPPAADGGPQLLATQPRWKDIAGLRRFAAQGDLLACLELGERLLTGEGLPRDEAEARVWFARAAEAGSGDALFRLGKLHHDGVGGPRDYPKALDYYARAARAGIPEAQHNVGAMLVSGRGVRRDYVEGLAWLIVATRSGAVSDAEQRTRERLARRPADIAAAERRAAELLAALAGPAGTAAAAPRAAVLPPPPVPAAVPPPVAPAAPPKVKIDLGAKPEAPRPPLDLPRS
jgi:TPR repeat protein